MFTWLLFYQWIEGELPADETDIKSLLRISPEEEEGWKASWARIERVFPLSRCKTQRRNKRLEKERACRKRFRKSRSDAGKLGAKVKKEKALASKALANRGKLNKQGLSISSSSSSSSSISREEKSNMKKKKTGQKRPVPAGSRPSPVPKNSKLKIPYPEIEEEWNLMADHTNLARIRGISPGRRDKLQARYKGKIFPARWKEAISKIPDIPSLLNGKNKTGWRMNFDSFIRNDDMILRILEDWDALQKRKKGNLPSSPDPVLLDDLFGKNKTPKEKRQ